MPATSEARAVGVTSSIANDKAVIATTMIAAFPRLLAGGLDISAGTAGRSRAQWAL